MAAQKGKDLLIKIDDGADFVTVAGLRTNQLAFNAETATSPTRNRPGPGASFWPGPAFGAPR
jgi:predicted secreted protein